MVTRKLSAGLIAVIFGIWFASWRGYTPNVSKYVKGQSESNIREVGRKNITQYLRDRHRFELNEDQVSLMRVEGTLLSPGKTFLVFFSARQHGKSADLYMMQARLGQNGLPISFTSPRNLTENEDSVDHLFQVDRTVNVEGAVARVLYGQMDEEGRCRSITYVNWASKLSGEKEDWLTRLRKAHYFDRWEVPQWLTLRFHSPVKNCNATFGDQDT